MQTLQYKCKQISNPKSRKDRKNASTIIQKRISQHKSQRKQQQKKLNNKAHNAKPWTFIPSVQSKSETQLGKQSRRTNSQEAFREVWGFSTPDDESKQLPMASIEKVEAFQEMDIKGRRRRRNGEPKDSDFPLYVASPRTNPWKKHRKKVGSCFSTRGGRRRPWVMEPAHSVSKIPLRATEIAALPNRLIDTLFLTTNNKQITRETKRGKERWIFW